MRVALLAGLTSLTANLLVLFAFIPLTIGFRPVIVLPIAFWTFFAAIGATITMVMLQKHAAHPTKVFIMLACVVFFVSLIPIYLHAGILHDFSPSLLSAAIYMLIVMHSADSILISALLISLARSRPLDAV